MLFNVSWQNFMGKNGNVFMKSFIPITTAHSFINKSDSTIAKSCTIKGEVASVGIQACSEEAAKDTVIKLMSLIAFHNVTGLSYCQPDARVPKQFYLTPAFPGLNRTHLWICPLSGLKLIMCDTDSSVTVKQAYSWAMHHGFHLLAGRWKNASLYGANKTFLLAPLNEDDFRSEYNNPNATIFGSAISSLLGEATNPDWSRPEKWRFTSVK